jgi:pimeloyl-ACP methyl ester carboxylesterase
MKVVANGIELEVQIDGPAQGEPLLLIMGLGMQLVAWPQELVSDLIARGFRVIRLDNRDVGLSQGFDHLGMPNLAYASLRYWLRLRVHSPYRLADMAADTVGVLDALGIHSAHVCGASMGGMVAQHLAATYPQRVRSLGLVMTTAGARHLPQPSLAVRKVLITPVRGGGIEAVVNHLSHVLNVIGSPAYPPEPERLRQRLLESTQRAYRPAGTARQLMAVVADGDRTPMIKRIHVPTLVFHGQADPLIPVAAAHHLANHLAGSTLEIVPGMGHDLPLQVLPALAQALATNAQRLHGQQVH